MDVKTGSLYPLKFKRLPSQYFDAETGLHYNMARYYDPTVGRYITSDPIGLDGGINTYLYSLANPINFYDPNGEATIKINGKKIRVHKYDADKWPSDPHGHIYDDNTVVDADGNIYDKKTKKKIGKLPKKATSVWKKFLLKSGRVVKCFAPLYFVYDVTEGGLGDAVNGALWPASELWLCEECSTDEQ